MLTIEAKDNSGNTALVYASLYGYIDIVKELLKRGADIEAMGKGNALIAASENGHLNVVK